MIVGRNFHEHSRHTALVFSAVLGLETVLGGCATLPKKSTQLLEPTVDEQVVEEEQRVYTMFKMFSSDWRYLEEQEYMLPAGVVGAMMRLFAQAYGTPYGGDGFYVTKNYSGEIDDFDESFSFYLRVSGIISEQEIATYKRICTTPGNIVLNDMLLLRGGTIPTLEHERYHREMFKLPPRKLKVMLNAYEQLMNQNVTSPQAKKYHVQESTPLVQGTVNGNEDIIRKKVEWSWWEFYPHLADGEFKPQVEAELKRQFPLAYRIHRKIKEAVKIQSE